MKIVLLGTANVGKSTMINDIIKKYPEFTKTSYNYRDAIKANGIEKNINKQTTEFSQNIIFNALFEELNTDQNNVLLDRSILDAVVYTQWAFLNSNTISDTFLTNQKSIMYENMNKYDLIIYIPLDESIAIVEDNLRETDLNYRREIAEIFEKLLFEQSEFDNFGYKIITISGSREERLLQFSDIYKVF